jgi:hypothetical protein
LPDRQERHANAAVGIGIRLGEPLGERLHFRAALFEGDARFETSKGHEHACPAVAKAVAKIGIAGSGQFSEHGSWGPQIECQAGHGTAELLGRYADDGEGITVHVDGGAHDSGIGVEARLPQRVADDDDRVAAWSVIPFAAGEEAAERRLDAQHIEEFAGDQLGPDALGAHAFADVHRPGCVTVMPSRSLVRSRRSR